MIHSLIKLLNGLKRSTQCTRVKLAQSVTIGPALGSYKGAVVFALVMFLKCSVFTSQFQTEDWEGRKHLLPVEEVHFQKTNADFTQRLLGLLYTETVDSGGERQRLLNSIYFGNLRIPPASSL